MRDLYSTSYRLICTLKSFPVGFLSSRLLSHSITLRISSDEIDMKKHTDTHTHTYVLTICPVCVKLRKIQLIWVLLLTILLKHLLRKSLNPYQLQTSCTVAQPDFWSLRGNKRQNNSLYKDIQMHMKDIAARWHLHLENILENNYTDIMCSTENRDFIHTSYTKIHCFISNCKEDLPSHKPLTLDEKPPKI